MSTSSIDFNKRLPRPLPPWKASDYRNSSPPTPEEGRGGYYPRRNPSNSAEPDGQFTGALQSMDWFGLSLWNSPVYVKEGNDK
ncbi:hypothetical protein CEXT_505521 [Caerostris extrusa]|uniref:Uncharacterized protein n=1 Tax=Caerostris extrusa TaxID=172846 RepID=A0AAV4VN02_CAEEX|nr:hypothetical protein CEXT_505521 [Caerostris extrusa]